MKHKATLAGLSLFIGVMGALPYVVRKNTPSISEREKLSGSQRVRGLFMNYGSSDAGIDPDWDHGTWKGWERRDRGNGRYIKGKGNGGKDKDVW